MTDELVAWDLALRIARPIIARKPPLESSELVKLQESFTRAITVAEALVEKETGLTSSYGPARGIVTDRSGWVEVNIQSFRRLLAPVLERVASSPRAKRMSTPANQVAAGIEVGLLLSWMSGRVLGQYDIPAFSAPATAKKHKKSSSDKAENVLSQAVAGHGEIRPVAAPDMGAGDVVYFVGENILALEAEHGFDQEQFRLWLALHEVTHRMQFTGIPWMREHFLGLVERGVNISPPDISVIVESLRKAASALFAGTNPIGDAGLASLFVSSDQMATLQEAQALMSLLEGHGDIVMNRAAMAKVPSASLFASTLHERRASGSALAKFTRQAIGIEAKMNQYAQGEHFVEQVFDAGGNELLARLWESPEMLPSLAEIRDPISWVRRASPKASPRDGTRARSRRASLRSGA